MVGSPDGNKISSGSGSSNGWTAERSSMLVVPEDPTGDRPTRVRWPQLRGAGIPLRCASATSSTASMMLRYPVQRQSTPDSSAGRSSRCTSGSCSSRSYELIRNPGVQKPHCRPWLRPNDSCKGCRSSGRPRPSTVVICAPSSWTANSRHARAASPSTSTVHMPHTPCSHPTWVPVRPRWSRSASERVTRAGNDMVTALPLTVMVTSTV